MASASLDSWVQANDNYSNHILLMALFILYGLFMLLYVPFCCYCSYELWNYSNEPYIKVRKAILSHIITITCILFVLKRLATHDMYCIVLNDCYHHDWSSNLKQPTTINIQNVVALCDLLWLMCCLPKIIYIYYEVSHQNALANEEWWRQMNDKLGQNIFIKYHNHIYTICGVAAMLFISLSLFVCYLFSTFGQISVYTVTSVLILIAALIMYHKLPHMDDIFYLRFELKHLLRTLLPIIVFFNLSNIFIYQSILWHIIDCIVFMISTSILVHTVTIKPIQMIQQPAQDILSIDNDPVASNSANEQTTGSPKSGNGIPVTWSEWISLSTHNFNRFMQTLTAELCVESILFIVEVTQYKTKIIKKIHRRHKLDISHDARRTSLSFSSQNRSISNVANMQSMVSSRSISSDMARFGMLAMLPSGIPRSPIVYSSKRLSVEKQMLQIYQKYINYPYAPFLINISHETRERVDEALNTLLSKSPHVSPVTPNSTEHSTKYKEDELLALLLVFEECLHDVYRLLNGSWNRLRRTLKHELTIPIEEIMEQKLKTMQR
eukprot:68331_1